MPQFEYEFNQQDRDLVVTTSTGVFGNKYDYIRLTIYPTEAIDNIVTLPDETKGLNGQAIFFSSLEEQQFNVNVSQFGAGLDTLNLKTIGGLVGSNDFQIYKTGETIYIKPNEIFNQFELPQGEYRIQIDFLNQLSPNSDHTNETNQQQQGTGQGDAEMGQTEGTEPYSNIHYQFIIKQISTSRKEVRLKLLDRVITPITNMNDKQTIQHITNEFNRGQNEYAFKHILNSGTGNHNPIMNYQFDGITDGKDNQSIILKLYEPLSTDIQSLSMVTIEREILTSQLQDIFYFSDVPDIFFGDGLVPDTQENWINPDGNNVGFENYNQLVASSSINDYEINSLISSSEYGYPNLNTNYNQFANHTFFGSAKKKLENFKSKVTTIQGHYSDISESLNSVGITLSGDSAFLIQKRKDLFKKINDEIKNFTPYERFLYFDGQSESTSSAPGVGKNYANTIPVSTENNYEQLKQIDGFKVVYKNSNTGATENISLFNNQYKVQNKPLFNYSGSVYLSFLLKGTTNLQLNRDVDNHLQTGFEKNGFLLPHDTMFTSSILQPTATGSEYRRFVFLASSSYFVPNVSSNDMIDLTEPDFAKGSSKITILTDSIKTGSSLIKDSTNKYPTTVISQSGIPFSGSILPAGDLFVINFSSGSGNAAVTQSFITDVKVSFNNPTNVLPFDTVYKTTSTEWTDWYNGMLTNAETFDTDNIHSFENNIPLYMKESSDFNDMKDFLNLQGEQYDVIKNHIDSLGTLHDRGYKKTNSPPENTYSMLLSNMGWQAINPFSGSLTDSLGGYLSGVTTIDDIKNNTWRKTLNNLLYIYKSKGTKNSVRALLNTYGYPPDVLQFQEFGGSPLESNPRIFVNTPPSSTGVDLSLKNSTGSFSFTSKKQKFYDYRIGGDSLRVLDTEHYRDGANIESIEFVYRHVKTTNEQKLLDKASNATTDLTNFDLRLIPSSDGLSSSFAFRLNNQRTGSQAIATNSVSMSTSFLNVRDGDLWNVMIQRMTASTSGTGKNEYRLHAALQDGSSIKTYAYVTMSIQGQVTNAELTGSVAMSESVAGRNYFANQNWFLTGSFSAVATIGNISFGGRAVPNTATNREITGSIAEIRGWSTALSTSKFRQHVLNKFSTVGNTINSHKDELVYHYKLNENYSSASVSASGQNLNIVDSAPESVYKDYTRTKSGQYFTGSVVYGFNIVDDVKLTLQDNSQKSNDNSIIINEERTAQSNLSAFTPAVNSLTNQLGKKPKLLTSPKLEIYRSPQTFVDNFILDNISGFNLEKLYGNPIYYHSQSYHEFDTFRIDFFDAHEIIVDNNKFIRAHENMFNHSIIEGLKQIVPARSTFSDRNANVGVEIKPTVLERQKYENEEHSVEANPNTGVGSIDTNIVKLVDKIGNKQLLTIHDSIKQGTALVNLPTTSSLELPKSASISAISIENVVSGSSVVLPKSASISTLPTYGGSTLVTSKNGTIDYSAHSNKSFVDVHKNWGTSSADVQFINYAGGTGSYGTFNTYDIEKKFVFHAVGDNEYYSASMGSSSNFSDITHFYNRLMIDNDFHASISYQSLIGASGNDSNQSGRMMGKTRYFRTGSDGTITLPRNHITKFSQPFKEQMINGTQNENPGFLNVRYEDYSTSSFYRVKVTGGQNQIIVQSGTPGLGADDKIIYDDNSGGGGAL